MSQLDVDPTCLLTAALRAKESRRPDRLYCDPFAERLTNERGQQFLADVEALTPEPGDRPCTVNFNAIRVRLFDDYLQEQVRKGTRQVVLAPAGLDTRAWRLDWPADLAWFELDRPDVLAYKGQRLPSDRRGYAAVGVDLTGDWVTPLLAAGFDATKPTAWVIEGLLYYWREPDVELFLQRVSSLSSPFSSIAADLVNTVGIDPTHPMTQAMAAIYQRWGVSWHYGTDDPEGLLKRAGFHTKVLEPGDAEATFGRWNLRMPPRAVSHIPRAFFAFGQRS